MTAPRVPRATAPLILILLAFAIVGAATATGASAASFEYSAKGTITGAQLDNQVLTTPEGAVICRKAATAAAVTELVFSHQEVAVKYSECDFTLLGSPVTVSEAKYDLRANGEAVVMNSIVINAGICSITVGPQTAKTVSYSNNSGKIVVHNALTGLSYTPSNFLCGSSGTEATFTGDDELELSGGTMTFVP